MKLIAISFILLCGCNRSLPYTPVVSVDSKLQKYVDEFTDESVKVNRKVDFTDLTVRFSYEMEEDVLGQCVNTRHPLVLINENPWYDQTETAQKIIMFHELGHCILNRKHVETWTNGIATSIMYPYVLADEMYIDNWYYYMHELFYGD